MGLTVRMFLYLIFGGLASQGLVIFDQIEGTVTFRVEDLTLIVSGISGYLATFGASRLAKGMGWST